MSGCPGGRYPIADQGESGAQLFRIELWPAGVPTLRAGGSDAVAGSLGDEAPFELRDRAEDMEDQFAGGRGGVDLFFEGEERDLSRLQDLDHLQQFAQRPSEPVEPHHGERIAGTGITWIQLASATFDLKAAISSAMVSAGVFHPSVLRGRPFMSRATSLSQV